MVCLVWDSAMGSRNGTTMTSPHTLKTKRLMGAAPPPSPDVKGLPLPYGHLQGLLPIV